MLAMSPSWQANPFGVRLCRALLQIQSGIATQPLQLRVVWEVEGVELCGRNVTVQSQSVRRTVRLPRQRGPAIRLRTYVDMTKPFPQSIFHPKNPQRTFARAAQLFSNWCIWQFWLASVTRTASWIVCLRFLFRCCWLLLARSLLCDNLCFK